MNLNFTPAKETEHYRIPAIAFWIKGYAPANFSFAVDCSRVLSEYAARFADKAKCSVDKVRWKAVEISGSYANNLVFFVIEPDFSEAEMSDEFHKYPQGITMHDVLAG